MPSLEPRRTKGRVVFDGVDSLYLRNAGKVIDVLRAERKGAGGRRSVVVPDGKLQRVSGEGLGSKSGGKIRKCTPGESTLDGKENLARIDLDGGPLA